MIRKNYRHLLLVIIFMALTWTQLTAQNKDEVNQVAQLQQAILADQQPTANLAPLSSQPCISGMADVYPCAGLDLLAFVPLAQMGGGQANDIWGWTDPLTSKEYALLGRTIGTAFLDISDPTNPIYLGNLLTHTGSSIWRDIKTYNNHAFIVSDNNGNHGLQVFDLTQLRDVTNPPVSFSPTAHYNGMGSAHNLAIIEETGYAIIVGSTSGNSCSGGLHMVDIHDPLQPTFAGCFSGDGYTHDAQCVLYHGSDPAYQEHEICFNANVDTLTIVDITDKSNPMQVARLPYSGSAYAHQGWLTADHNTFFLSDELDETSFGHNTRTYIWNVANLANAQVVGSYTAITEAIDHNLYTHNGRLYQTNYRAGLRVLNIDSPTNPTETAYFDIYPSNDSPNFNGAWSNYPFFNSGTIIVSGIEQGLFILRHSYLVSLKAEPGQRALPSHTITHELVLHNQGAREDSYNLSLNGATWPTTLLTSSPLTLTIGMTATVQISVTVPTVTWGEMDSFTVTAASINELGLTATAVLTTLAAPSPAISLTPTTQTQTAEWGDTITHTLTLTNSGNYTDTVTLISSGNQWPTSILASTGSLVPNESMSVPIAVQVPNPFAGEGPILANDVLLVTAVSTLDSAVTAQASTTTHIDVSAGISTSGDTHGAGILGQVVAYTLAITNSGEITDTFTLTLGNSQWDSRVDTGLIGPLAVNGRYNLTISVTVGTHFTDSLTLTLTSQLDITFTRDVTFITSRLQSSSYLPFIRRP